MKKVAHYPDQPPGFTFHPVGLSTQVGAGAQARAYFAALGLGLERRRNGTDQPRARQTAAVTREVYARVGAALMRAHSSS